MKEPDVSKPAPAPEPESSQESASPTPTTAVVYTDAFAPKVTAGVQLGAVTVEDCDQLWDWVRADPEGTSRFIGTFQNSRELYTYIGNIAVKERNGVATLYAIREQGLIGFILLDPIYRTDGQRPVGTTHIYLSPETQGRLPALLPSLMSEADRLVPGMNLCVVTQRPEWATMLQAVGFKSQYVLTRESPVKGA